MFGGPLFSQSPRPRPPPLTPPPTWSAVSECGTANAARTTTTPPSTPPSSEPTTRAEFSARRAYASAIASSTPGGTRTAGGGPPAPDRANGVGGVEVEVVIAGWGKGADDVCVWAREGKKFALSRSRHSPPFSAPARPPPRTMQAVTASFGRLGLSSTRANRGTAVAAPRPTVAVRAAPLAAFAKQNSVQRTRLAEKARLYNKARKSEVATRIKKVSPGRPGAAGRGGGGSRTKKGQGRSVCRVAATPAAAAACRAAPPGTRIVVPRAR